MKTWIRIFLIAFALNATTALATTHVTIHKSPTCGCCENYVEYLRSNGFEVQAIDESDMSAIKKRYGSTHLASCHTALVGGYVVEGHVPVAAIRKLLKEKPQVIGISVPGMQMNSPGMGEMKRGTLTVYTIPKKGEEPRVFSVE